MDFTFSEYKIFLTNLKQSNWRTSTLENYNIDTKKIVLFRHDVDRNPQNTLEMAKLEADLGIKASYYFRFVLESYTEEIIKEIVGLGHEIGYHYENLSQVGAKGNRLRPENKGTTPGQENETGFVLKKRRLRPVKKENGLRKAKSCKESEKEIFELALEDFEKNLDKLRKFYPVKTMCMHGSPMSKWDNRELWEKYDYRKYGIICEPYFDLDFNKVFYITDASRSWNNEKVSIRDKVESNFNIPINSTQDIINLIQSEDTPNQIMINIHPHNWANSYGEWLKIYAWQGMKNIVKRFLVRRGLG